MVRIQLNIIQLFFRVNNNTYQNTHENSNNSILNKMYNTLHNQSTIKFYYKPGLKHYYYYFCVYSNKYYYLLKKKKMFILHWLCVSNVRWIFKF